LALFNIACKLTGDKYLPRTWQPA